MLKHWIDSFNIFSILKSSKLILRFGIFEGNNNNPNISFIIGDVILNLLSSISPIGIINPSFKMNFISSLLESNWK